MIFAHSRHQIWNKNQHPYAHSIADFPYTNPALPTATVTNLEQAMDWLFAVLYPQTQPAVDEVADLPTVGNTINDYRVVLDDGDSKSASYRWEQREGDAAAKWYKIYDMDWGEDSILEAFITKTQDSYVFKRGYDDLDDTGAALAGALAGQHIYGGASASTHLTLHANSGDGVGADTGYIQLDDHLRPTADSALTLGTTAERWLKVWTDEITIGTLTITAASITDSSGTIAFGNENLDTDGAITAGTLMIQSGSITDISGDINFGDEYLTTTGVVTAGAFIGGASTLGSGTTIGTLTLADGSITDSGGEIDFGDEDLVTLGGLTAASFEGAFAAIGNILIQNNAITSTDTDGDITLTPNGTGIVDITKAMETVGQTITGTVGITGQLNADNIRIDGNTISSTNASGSILLDPNGSGAVLVGATLFPDTDSSFDLGATTFRFGKLFIDDAISDGTTEIVSSVIQSLRDINSGVDTGMSIFWNGSKWVSSLPDTEIDHGEIDGKGDDDHTQYMLLAGRSGGQSLIGGTGSGDNLTLTSTSHGTLGDIICASDLIPGTDNTFDLGDASFSWKDLYLDGQLIGARVQNATTAGRPAASAGTIGRLVYDTDLADVFVDRGGTWKKLSLEKYVIQDAVEWDGATLEVAYTVSSEVSDARECIWVFKDNSNAFEQMAPEITMTQTAVTVTFGEAPAAGTYTLVGVG